jgi:hypothetical protein
VGGQRLLHQCRARPRQAGDEDRPPARLGLLARPGRDPPRVVALDGLFRLPAIHGSIEPDHCLHMLRAAGEGGEGRRVLATRAVQRSQGVEVGRALGRRGAFHRALRNDQPVGDRRLAREVCAHREGEPRAARLRARCRHPLEPVPRLVGPAEIERGDTAAVGIGHRVGHGLGQRPQQRVRFAPQTGMSQRGGLLVERYLRAAGHLDVKVDRLAGEAQLGDVGRDLRKLQPLVAHRRTQRDELADHPPQPGVILRCEGWLQLPDKSHDRGKVAVGLEFCSRGERHVWEVVVRASCTGDFI